MGFLSSLLFVLLFFSSPSSLVYGGDPLVPALIIFGNSNVDRGNNNYVPTLAKANFLPYGRDFVTHMPTGRFSNGKLVSDYISELLGFSLYQRAYLSEEANRKNLLIGANFASAGSGFNDFASEIYGTISLTRQLLYYKEYQMKVNNLVGLTKANEILSDTLFLLSSGNSDLIAYTTIHVNKVISPPDEYINKLLTHYTTFIQELYALGARKIAATNAAPIGCVPLVITALGFGNNQCIASVNHFVTAFNQKLLETSEFLNNTLPGLRLLLLDIYTPFFDIITRPTFYGLSKSRRACCGTGIYETSILCNPNSIGTCFDASKYVFWDAVHPSQDANRIIAMNLFEQGKSLIAY